jgi:ribonuclease J
MPIRYGDHIESTTQEGNLNRSDELVFLPLGGTGEIGMNLNLYGYGGKWLMVDLGISFADDTMPGVEIIMPDPAFIVERREDLLAIVATHGHEDHIGAIPHLWSQLRCPIYATPFTASLLRMKLADAGLLREATIIEVPLSSHFEIGPFRLELITLTHSIPEPNALVIRTDAGSVLHTGDWKFDPDPLIGDVSDFAALERLGKEGIAALIGDSTNALKQGGVGSEADVRRSLIELVGQCKKRVAIGCFASNVARLQSAAVAAYANGRTAALVGRSLLRMEQAARENGYLEDTPPFIDAEDAAELPPEKVLLICTGSQGEPRSALYRIAAQDHPEIDLSPGDTVIFSSRIIPGNERSIGRLHNQLVRRGIEIITENDHFVHVSGHPAQDELTRMYQLVRPQLALPVHGESRHLIAHAKLAAECQVPHTVVAENGDMVRLCPGPPGIIDHVDTGRLGLDGKNLVALEGGAFRMRHRITLNGAAVATILLDGAGKFAAPPQVTMHGLLGDSTAVVAQIIELIEKNVAGMTSALRRDDEAVRDTVRAAVRRVVQGSHGKKPVTDVHLFRV